MKVSRCIINTLMFVVVLTGLTHKKTIPGALAYKNDDVKKNDRTLVKRIVGGSTAAFGEFPSYVYLHGIGGGTLVHGDAILTSASLKGYFVGNNVSIGGNIYDDQSDSIETITVRKEVSNPYYKFPFNNIMIVFLHHSSIAPIQIVNYMTTPVMSSTPVTTIGYGSVSNLTTDIQSLTLQKVSYKITSCSSYENDFNRPLRFICAGSDNNPANSNNNTGKGICIGDEGSPLLVVGSNTNKYEQIGIANFKKENDCGTTDDIPDGYTRVSYHRKWIQRTICFNTMILPLPNYCTCTLCNKSKDIKCRQLLCRKK